MSARGWGTAVVGAVVVAAVLAGAAAGCSGRADTATSSEAAAPAVGGDAARATVDAAAPGQAPTALAAVQPAERKLIRNGDISLAVVAGSDVDRVADSAVATATDAGGRVDGDRRAGGETPTADLVLRVPPDGLDAVVDRLGSLATVTSSSIQSDDVTNQYTDLEGRIEALQTSTARLRGFLAEATNANEIASLENELTQREASLESLQGQLRVLTSKTDLATLRVAVRTQQSVATASAPAPLQALSSGWDTFRLSVSWAVAVVLVTAPFLVFLTVVVVGVRWWRRHRPAAVAVAAGAE